MQLGRGVVPVHSITVLRIITEIRSYFAHSLSFSKCAKSTGVDIVRIFPDLASKYAKWHFGVREFAYSLVNMRNVCIPYGEFAYSLVAAREYANFAYLLGNSRIPWLRVFTVTYVLNLPGLTAIIYFILFFVDEGYPQTQFNLKNLILSLSSVRDKIHIWGKWSVMDLYSVASMF